MKLQIVSDLHLEFSPIQLSNAGADILVLAGDIYVADYFTRSDASPMYPRAQAVIAWFGDICSKFDHVIYVMGNHEHYHGTFADTAEILRNVLDHLPNLHILDKSFIELYGYMFVGGTLWTNFGHNPVNAQAVRNGLNDYHCVKGPGYRKLSPSDTIRDHNHMVQTIRDAAADQPTIVIGHHAPSWASIHTSYAGDILNWGYASHLDDFIYDYSHNIPLWIHGHTHNSFDYMVDNTRILCNPRGYQKGNLPAENRNFNPDKVIEL